MKTYLSTLNEREKLMVFSAVFCVLFYVYYFLLYSPLVFKVKERTEQLIEKSQTLEWMNKVAQKKPSSETKQSLDNGQLLTLLDSKLKDSPALKYPYNVQQTSSGEVQISFDKVPFNSFIEWLTQINQHYIIKVKQLEVNKTDTPGISQLMIVISAA